MMNKYFKLLVVIGAFLILSIATVASFAYYTASVEGNNNANSNVITSGTLSLDFHDNGEKVVFDAIPGAQIDKMFSVHNNGSVETAYNIYLSEIINTFVDKNDLVYDLYYRNDSTDFTFVYGDLTGFTKIVDDEVVPSIVGESSKIGSTRSIDVDRVDTYLIRFKFREDNSNQDDNKNRRFTAKININNYLESSIKPAVDYLTVLKNNGASDLEYDGVDTLGEYGTEDNNLRYYGANPNNYVYFNCTSDDPEVMGDSTCEKWRIVGVFNNIEDQNGNVAPRVKIIRDVSLGNYSWDSSASSINSGWGINQWGSSGTYEGADLYRELNTDYLGNITVGTDGKWYNGDGNKKKAAKPASTLNATAQKMISTVNWKHGSLPAEMNNTLGQTTIVDFYTYERGNSISKGCASSKYCNDSVERTTSTIAKVGLLYASDYGYSSSGGANLNRSACISYGPLMWMDESNIENISDCYNNTWLVKNIWYWIFPPYAWSGNASESFGIGESGYMGLQTGSNVKGVFPVVYLDNSVVIFEGNGTSNNPYKLAINSPRESK
ncbi:MAG: hypothetical protein E7159_02140 [Firmicutes bacterium]|nr:hypothetical protein [Bacillota bacterium]